MLSSGRTFSLAGEVLQVGMEVLIAILNVIVMREHFYIRTLANLLQSGNETTQKSNASYVSTLAENGPAMARPAGLVPAPMCNHISFLLSV